MSDYPGDDREIRAQRLDGLFTGSLDPREYEDLIEIGYLRKSWEGALAILGLSKLRYVERDHRVVPFRNAEAGRAGI